MQKINVGDRVRVVKPEQHEHKVGEEFVVTSVTTQWLTHEGCAYGENTSDDSGFFFEELEVIPQPAFVKGDKVRLTPKDGGETVIVGEVYADWSDVLDLTPDGTIAYIAIQKREWNTEKIQPSTEDILNGLGENAFVAHRTDVYYYGYYKRGGKWYDADADRSVGVSDSTVAEFIDVEGFEIVFEGVKP